MKAYEPVKAPVDFSRKVMEQINAPVASKTVYKPVFNKWFMRFLFGGLVAFIIYAMSGSTSEASQKPELINSLAQKLPKIELNGLNQLGQQFGELISGIPSVVIFTLLAASLLLLLDVFILKRFRQAIAV